VPTSATIISLSLCLIGGGAFPLLQGCTEAEKTPASSTKPGLAVNEATPTIERIQELQKSGRLSEAIDLTRTMVKAEPQRVDLRILLAQSYSQQKDTAKALRQFTIALELDPENTQAMELQAFELRTQGLEDEAERVLRTLLKLQPKHLAAWRELARVHQSRGQWAKAIEVTRTMIGLDPNRIAHFLRIARAYINLNRIDEAKEALLDGVRRDPRNPQSRAMLASILTSQGHFLKAMEQAQILITLQPEYPNAAQLFELAAYLQVQWQLGCKFGDGPYNTDDVKTILAAYAAEGMSNAEAYYPRLVARYAYEPQVKAQLQAARALCPTKESQSD
jgi:tetratricopeptide (TPR) repeat protein